MYKLIIFFLLFNISSTNQIIASDGYEMVTVRQINWIGLSIREDYQRLIISRPGEEPVIRKLKQSHVDSGMNDKIDFDNKIIMEEFVKLYNEGYKLANSTTSNYAVPQSGSTIRESKYDGVRETTYIFIKE